MGGSEGHRKGHSLAILGGGLHELVGGHHCTVRRGHFFHCLEDTGLAILGGPFQDTDRGLVIIGIRFQDTGRGLAILEEHFHKETALTLESSRKSWTIQYQWDTIGKGLAISGHHWPCNIGSPLPGHWLRACNIKRTLPGHLACDIRSMLAQRNSIDIEVVRGE